MQVMTQKGTMKQEPETRESRFETCSAHHFSEGNEGFSKTDTVLAQNSVETGTRKVKFPQTIRYHKAEVTISGKTPSYPRYRLSYYVAGKRRQLTFATYGEAKAEAERVVRELAKGSQTTALTASQARDSLAAFQCLEGFLVTAGRKLTLLGAVSEFVEAASKLRGQSLGDAVTRYLATVANVTRKDVREAVEEFIAADEPRTRAVEGQRAQLSAKSPITAPFSSDASLGRSQMRPCANLAKPTSTPSWTGWGRSLPRAATATDKRFGNSFNGACGRTFWPAHTDCVRRTPCAPNTPTVQMFSSTLQGNSLSYSKPRTIQCGQLSLSVDSPDFGLLSCSASTGRTCGACLATSKSLPARARHTSGVLWKSAPRSNSASASRRT